MPTLIRFLVVLLVLAGLVGGTMLALTIFVAPPAEEVTVRVPAQTLYDD